MDVWKKNIVYEKFSTIQGVRHMLGILEHIFRG